MKRLLFLAVLVATAGFAQEIGTEITPAPAAPQPEQPQRGYVYHPQGKQTPNAAWDGQRATATAGTFGIRAGFGSSGVTALSTSGTVSAVGAPFIGASLMVSNNLKLLGDVGFGLGIFGSTSAWSLGASVGVDFLFRTPADALRPLLYGHASFGMSGTSGEPAVRFGVEVGAGAEYFLSPNFALHGKIGLAVPMAIAGSTFAVGIFTLSPGLGATFYF